MTARRTWSERATSVFDRCENGHVVRCLTLVDEGTRKGLAISVEASQPARRVSATLEAALATYGESAG